MTRLVLIAAILWFAAGCSNRTAQRVDETDSRQVSDSLTPAQAAARAKDALLELMRGNRSTFEGADPDHFASIPVKQSGPQEFSWGAFTINLEHKWYAAVVEIGACTHFYNGRFDVDEEGRWVARDPTVAYALAPPSTK